MYFPSSVGSGLAPGFFGVMVILYVPIAVATSPPPSTVIVLSSVGPAYPLPKSTQYFLAASPFTIGSPGGSRTASATYRAAIAWPSPALAARAHSSSTALTLALSSSDRLAAAGAPASDPGPAIPVSVLGRAWQAAPKTRSAARLDRMN